MALAVSVLVGWLSSECCLQFFPLSGKSKRLSRYEEEFSDGQHLGINERELNSMNKHIPGESGGRTEFGVVQEACKKNLPKRREIFSSLCDILT